MKLNPITYACGCSITKDDAGVGWLAVRPCREHGEFSIVKRALRTVRDALSEAHEQLPPGPKEAA